MYNDGMFWATFGMTWIFGCVAVLLIIWHLRGKRQAERQRLIHEERMKAMEKGIPLPEFPDLSEEAKMERFNTIFTPPKLNPRWPLGVGVLLIFFGAGWVVAWLLSADSEAAKIWSMGLVSVFLGFGLFLYYYLTRQPEKS